jgi:hypothetical protein
MKRCNLLLTAIIWIILQNSFKLELAKVIKSSCNGKECYVLVVCQHGLIGVDSPKEYQKRKEIYLEYRNTTRGIEHRVKEMS